MYFCVVLETNIQTLGCTAGSHYGLLYFKQLEGVDVCVLNIGVDASAVLLCGLLVTAEEKHELEGVKT